MPKKYFVIFAGPNGSGKSTLVKSFMEKNPSMLFVNADYIAMEEFAHISDLKERSWAAMMKTEESLEILLKNGKDVGFETVLSSDYKWRFIELARKLRYTVISIFVTTNSADKNWERVQKRVKENGHSVEEDKVRSRYDKSLDRLPRLLSQSNISLVYDNSIDEQKPLLFKYSIYSSNNVDLPQRLTPVTTLMTSTSRN